MPIVDLTLDSSDEDTSAFEKHKTVPFSDNNVFSKTTSGNPLQSSFSNSTPQKPVPKLNSKNVARVTSKVSILDRLSRPIQFETPIIKSEVVKKEESDSDSDSQSFFANPSFFFPKVLQKSELPPSKLEIKPSTVAVKTSVTNAKTPVSVTVKAAAATKSSAKQAAPVYRGRGRPRKVVVTAPLPITSVKAQIQGIRGKEAAVELTPIWPQFGSPNGVSSTVIYPQLSGPLQSKPQQGIAQQSKPQQGVALQSKPQQGVALQSKPQQGVALQSKPQQGVAQQSKPQQGVAQQSKPQQGVAQQSKPQQGVAQQVTSQRPIRQSSVRTRASEQITTALPSQNISSRTRAATSNLQFPPLSNQQSPPITNPLPPIATPPPQKTSRKRTTQPPPIEESPAERPKRQRKQTTPSTDSRILPVESMLEVANMQLKGNESRDVLEMVNCCRYLDYVIQNYRGMPLISLYKRFVKSKHYIQIEPEVINESVIESPDTTPVKQKQKQTVAKIESIKTVLSEISTVYSVLTYPFKAAEFYLSSQLMCSTDNSRIDSLIHSICSCLHTEFDFRALNNYSLKNYCLKEKWICELLSSTTVDDLIIATRVNHYLFWMKQRFQLRLSFFREFLFEIIDLIGDIIEGNEVKRRGRKPKLSLREEEEKERKQKNYVVSSVSLLSLVSLLLLDELRNDESVIEDPNQYQEALKKCMFAVWDKTSRLARNPQLWLFAKKLMARVLNLICSHQPDPLVRRDFLHFLVMTASNETLMDLLFMATEDQFKAELLGELSSSKKTRYSALMKNHTVALMAKQYGFKTQTKLAPSSLLILSLSEKIKKITN